MDTLLSMAVALISIALAYVILIVISAFIKWIIGISRITEEQEKTNRYLSSISRSLDKIEKQLKKED